MLIARVNAILCRIDQINSKGTSISFGDLGINTSTYIAKLDGEELHLPRKEFELLAFFMSHPNIIFSRDGLLSLIWEEDVFVVDRTIGVHINRIRSKLGSYKNWIETVKGVGYRFRPKL
jgi:two-component system alkaline phosphatase synthesis response regulator PhoP